VLYRVLNVYNGCNQLPLIVQYVYLLCSGQDSVTISSSTHAQLRKNIQDREALSRLKSKLEEQKSKVSANLAQQAVDKVALIKEPTEHREAIVQSSTSASVKLPPRKVTIAVATPPKRILPKVAPAVATECLSSMMSNHAGGTTALNGTTAHYVLLSPNPANSQTQMFIIPPPMLEKQAAIPAPANVGSISLVPQSPIVSHRPAVSSMHSVNNPIMYSPLVSADTVRPSSVSVNETSSATIRNISFIDVVSETRPAEQTKLASLPRQYSSSTNDSSALGLGQSAILEVRELVKPVIGTEVLTSSEYSNVSNFIDVLLGQNCGNAVEARQGVNEGQALLSTSVVAMPVGVSSSVELANNQNTNTTHNKFVSKQKVHTSSKTVMSLLRQSDSDGSTDQRSYMKDSRPVARILKEEREKQLQQANSLVNDCTSSELIWSSVDLSNVTRHHKDDDNSSQFLTYPSNKVPISTNAPCSLLKELLTSRTSTSSRRSSFDRPSSVTDVTLSSMLPQLLSPGLETVDNGSSLNSSRSSRKRPHTALDDPFSTSGIWQESVGADRSSSVDFIEKNGAPEDILIFHDVLQSLLSAQHATKVVQQSSISSNHVGSSIDFCTSFSQDVDKSNEPPIKKLTFVNRSVENLTLQQLQQARDINSRTTAETSYRAQFERWRQSYGDQPVTGSRPLSAFGEPIPASDMSSLRDSRPNTVAAIWEPTNYHGCSSSADSCDGSEPVPSALSQEQPFFTPIQVQGEDITTGSCDLVKPLAKVAINNTDNVTGVISIEGPTKQCAYSEGVSSSPCLQDLPGLSSLLAHGRASKRIGRVWHKYSDPTCLPDEAQSKLLTGMLLSPSFRSETPLSTEVSNIIASVDRHLLSCTVGDSSHVTDDTASPHRSQSVPVGFLFDLDDISAEFANDPCFDVFDGKSEPSYSDLDDFQLLLRRPTRRVAIPENRAGFWESLPRGDHLISGTSFCPEQCEGTIARTGTGCHGVGATTPPSSPSPSPSIDAEYQLSRPAGYSAGIKIDTPTSLEQGSSAAVSVVDDLLVFRNNSQLAEVSNVEYEWEDDVVNVGRLIAD